MRGLDPRIHKAIGNSAHDSLAESLPMPSGIMDRRVKPGDDDTSIVGNHKSIVLGANNSSIPTRRAVSPCSCTYWAMVSSTFRAAFTP